MDTLPFVHLALAPLVLVVFLLFKKKPPKERNIVYGYRTPASMRNQDTWKEANEYSAKWGVRLVWGVLGFIQIPTFLFMKMEESIMISSGALVVAVVAVIIMTEIRLRKVFNGRGEWKEDMV
jgi:uncharacterized membrane protein